MPILEVYVSDETMRRLEQCASELGRDPDELAEAAVAEAALAAFRNRPDAAPAALPLAEILGETERVGGTSGASVGARPIGELEAEEEAERRRYLEAGRGATDCAPT